MELSPEDYIDTEIIRSKLSEIKPLSFNAKYISKLNKPYIVSRGKSKFFKLSLLYLFIAICLWLISINLSFINWTDQVLESTWVQWLPRIFALAFLILGIMYIKRLKEVFPLLTIDHEGIKYEENIIHWNEIEDIYVKYSAYSNDYFAVFVQTKGVTKEFDLHKVDEFSEDVAVILNKYYVKYGQTQTTVN